MNYTQVPNTYKYDMLAENIYSREMEYFHYEFDKTNFLQMLATMPEGDAKNNIQQRLNETQAQMDIVNNIYNALLAQVDNQEAYAAAVARAEAKRSA